MYRDVGIAVNALWPRTTIATAAVKNLLGGDDMVNRSRTEEIMADAAYEILTRNSRQVTGNILFIHMCVCLHVCVYVYVYVYVCTCVYVCFLVYLIDQYKYIRTILS